MPLIYPVGTRKSNFHSGKHNALSTWNYEESKSETDKGICYLLGESITGDLIFKPEN